MKNIFRKLHIGSVHDPNRSGEVPTVPALISRAVSTSCASDHRTVTAAPPALPTMTPPSPPEGVSVAASVERVDYFSTEEEFQVQLALAISASNSEFRDDPDSDQIRIATLLSLGTSRGDEGLREEEAAESLARRYWDYNVLDYDEKVVDGFYDIFGLSTNLNRGKMPSLHDLQTSIGDLGFEVIIVNRAIDTALVELEQVAHCIALDVPATEVMLLVQRISELVSQNMGGPVKDANDILARWIEKSSELRTSLQTSLLPISFIDVGLSRHRALLFKVLADNIGISCKLVKGSHYTGVDEDAVNIIKFGDNREFLVDLMAAPGTLIPADMLSTKDTTLISCRPLLYENILGTAIDHSGDDFRVGKNKYFNLDGDTMLGTRASTEKAVLLPSVLGESSSTVSSSSVNPESFYLQVLSNQLSSSISEASKLDRYKVPEFAFMKEKLKEGTSGDALDLGNLFADLNPLQALGVGKYSSAFEADDNKTNEYLKPRESVASGPERPQHQSPLVRKNHAPCNDISNLKHFNISVGLPRKKNLGFRDLNSSHYTSSATGSSLANPFNCSGIACSVRPDDTSSRNPYCSSGAINNSAFVQNCKIAIGGFDPPADEVLIPIQFKEHGFAFHNNMIHKYKERDTNIYEHKEGDKNINANRDRKRLLHDKFLDRNMASGDANQSSPSALDKFIGNNEGSHDTNPSPSLSLSKPNRIDPMLDDVAEWELPWEDLIIGERIGLGSYGEVYCADWNGTEVAVKKFLDQDFYGDALDEFRSEVWIMRRLRHPNVVLFMGAVTRPPNLSIVSEFLPRGSLYKILHRPNCQIDEKRRIKMALDVAKGMNCLHTSAPTIVHRDLKSPNLLVDNNWTVKVCDFGLSRLKHNTFLSSKSTAGTPEWMAPEVLRNEPSNEKCDIYSFGVILWELATLRMPWRGMNPMQVVGAVGFQQRRLEIPKEVDPLVGRIIWECWQTDPSLRPSFAQLTTALKSLQRLVIPLHHDPHIASVPVQIPVNSTP